MTRILRITLLCLCLLLAYLGTAAAWAGAVFDRLAATLPPAQGMLLSPRQNAILLAVEDPDFATHHGISFADGQGIATITAAVARDFFLSDTRLDGVAGLFQRFYAGVQRCCKAVDIGRDAMALVLRAYPSRPESLLARLASGCCVARRCMASHAASSRLARACHASPSASPCLLG